MRHVFLPDECCAPTRVETHQRVHAGALPELQSISRRRLSSARLSPSAGVAPGVQPASPALAALAFDWRVGAQVCA